MTDPERAAQAWLLHIRRMGLTVTAFGGEVYVFGEGKAAKYRRELEAIDQHRVPLLAILEREDVETRFATARAAYPAPEVLEGMS